METSKTRHNQEQAQPRRMHLKEKIGIIALTGVAAGTLLYGASKIEPRAPVDYAGLEAIETADQPHLQRAVEKWKAENPEAAAKIKDIRVTSATSGENGEGTGQEGQATVDILLDNGEITHLDGFGSSQYMGGTGIEAVDKKLKDAEKYIGSNPGQDMTYGRSAESQAVAGALSNAVTEGVQDYRHGE